MSDKIKTINIDEFVEGNPVFKSDGVSYVKVTRAGKVEKLAIPIRSTGVAVAIDEFRKQMPTPPVVNVVVRPNDPAYSDLGLTKKQHIKTYDLTDTTYLEKKEKYESDLGMKIVLLGINIPIKDKDGKIIEDDMKKIEILKSMGMSGNQFTQICADIQSLTEWEDAKEDDFL